MKLLKNLTAISFIAALQASAFGSLVNETWSDGERLTQDIPNNSLAWYTSSGGSNLTATTGSMTQATGTSGRHAIAYFTPGGSPATLAEGESLKLSFTVSFPRASALGTANDFRVGLWDSQNDRVNIDDHKGTSSSNGNAAFSEYTGYVFSGGLESSRSISIRRKDGGTDPILIASTSVYSTLGSTATDHSTLSPNTDYMGEFILERLDAGSLMISYLLTDGSTTFASIQRTDESSPHFSFDTVGFVVGSNVADGFTLSQVEISVIPEPGHFALLFGALSLGWLALRRRNKAA